MRNITQFYFVRHGEPLWSLAEERRLKGTQRDLVPLTIKGILQVEQVALEPGLQKAEIIIASPYTRALQTAAIISRKLNLPLMVEYDLHEWLPDLSLEYDSIGRLMELTKDYEKNNGIYPEGETRVWETKENVRKRVRAVLHKYLGYSHVIVVCHGMVIRSQVNVTNIPFAGIVEMQIGKGDEDNQVQEA